MYFIRLSLHLIRFTFQRRWFDANNRFSWKVLHHFQTIICLKRFSWNWIYSVKKNSFQIHLCKWMNVQKYFWYNSGWKLGNSMLKCRFYISQVNVATDKHLQVRRTNGWTADFHSIFFFFVLFFLKLFF